MKALVAMALVNLVVDSVHAERSATGAESKRARFAVSSPDGAFALEESTPVVLSFDSLSCVPLWCVPDFAHSRAPSIVATLEMRTTYGE